MMCLNVLFACALVPTMITFALPAPSIFGAKVTSKSFYSSPLKTASFGLAPQAYGLNKYSGLAGGLGIRGFSPISYKATVLGGGYKAGGYHPGALAAVAGYNNFHPAGFGAFPTLSKEYSSIASHYPGALSTSYSKYGPGGYAMNKAAVAPGFAGLPVYSQNQVSGALGLGHQVSGYTAGPGFLSKHSQSHGPGFVSQQSHTQGPGFLSKHSFSQGPGFLSKQSVSHGPGFLSKESVSHGPGFLAKESVSHGPGFLSKQTVSHGPGFVSQQTVGFGPGGAVYSSHATPTFGPFGMLGKSAAGFSPYGK